MAPASQRTEALIEQLNDPARCDQALLAIIAKGRSAVPALAAFLRASKPSSLAQTRLLAVEGLSILKGASALDALIEVAEEHLTEISDPAVRLAEESVASRAASALAEFPDARPRAALLQLLDAKPLLGVAEAFEKLKDPRAIPSLVRWLEQDFVAEAAARAIVACGCIAVPVLLDSLRAKPARYGREAGISPCRKARILRILCELAVPESVESLDDLLDDPDASVRLNAVRLLFLKGTLGQRRKAFRAGLKLLQSSRDDAQRVDCEELLISHFDVCPELVEEAIQRRRLMGESEGFWPQETALAILLRIRNKGRTA
jgi:HEAT repeat protein